MDALDLLPESVPLRLQALQWRHSGLHLELATTAESADCPLCLQPSQRVHSRYGRTLADLPCSGRAVRLELGVRKFFCTNPDCERHIFTEPLPELAARYARRTLRLQEVLHCIGLFLGGAAGARLSHQLHLTTSPDTILRALGRWQPVDLSGLRVLGVDDFAFRRGHTYGTILVDLERHRVVDLLPDRQAQTFADWLQQHPGIEIISRDRSDVYAQGARDSAPDAIQVADRWHLLKNLVDALENLLVREHSALRGVARELADQLALTSSEGAVPTRAPASSPPASSHLDNTNSGIGSCAAPLQVGRLAQQKQERRARRLARYEQVQELYRQGMTLRGIAHATHLSRKTVSRLVQAPEFPERSARQPRPTKLDTFRDYLTSRWESGCHNAAQLYREIHSQDYRGGPTLVKDYLRLLRTSASGVALGSERQVLPKSAEARYPTLAVPSVRQVLWWLLRPDEQLEEKPQQFVGRLCRISCTIRHAREIALWFMRLVRERRAEEFGVWIATARESGLPYLKGFAQRLLSDRAAVVAALSHEWSNGQTEGQVNRLKLIKRQMYGRAGFALLRARVLAAA